MAQRALTLILGCAACGRVGFDVHVEPDAATSCEQAWFDGPRLSVPHAVSSVNAPGSALEIGTFLDYDNRTLYFSSDRTGAYDIYQAQRASPTSPFGPPSVVPEFSGSANELEVTLRADGLEAFLSSDHTGVIHIMEATRATMADPFGSFTDVATINSLGEDYNPELSLDGLRLYFASLGRSGGAGATDLLMASRATPQSAFDAPTFITELDSPADEASPRLTASERVIVFVSNRPGTAGLLDIWYATRASSTDPFGPALQVPGVSTVNKEWQPALRADGCELFFTLYDGVVEEDIYVSEIVP